MRFFQLFSTILAFPLRDDVEELNSIFTINKGPRTNGEQNFPFAWWETDNEYEDDLPVPVGQSMGPNGPCHHFLRQIQKAKWVNRKFS